MFKNYRVKSKFRFTVFIVLMVVLTVTAFSTLIGLNNVSGSDMDEYKVITVQSGDTLWSIAESNYDNSKDIRKVISQICEANDIKASDLKDGDQILIPVN